MTDLRLVPATIAAAAMAPAGAAFAAPQSAPATRFLDRPHGRIAYDDQGAGPLVVMVPGLGDIRQEYRFLAPRLVEAGFRAVTLDIRGHGDSSTGWPDHTSSALGDDVLALVEQLGAGPALIIGTSMGAGAAAWAAAAAPRLVSGLVLIGPFVREVPPANWLKGITQRVMIKIAFAGPWARSAWGSYYDSLYPTRKPADYAAYRAKLLANLAEPGRLAALKAMMNAKKTDVEARLGEVHTPTLVVMGTLDPDFADPAVEAETVASLLNGRVKMIDGAGHYPHAEMPEVTAPAIIDFLAGRLDT